MYRPLAGQLRILLCDTQRKKDNSLLVSAFPKLEISSLAAISWSENESAHVQLRQPDGGQARVSEMPFEISRYANGLAIADLLLTPGLLVPVGEWSKQLVTVYPTSLTVFDVIRAVADKGGGAHVDAESSYELRQLVRKTPSGATYAEMFILALGRYIQQVGERLFDYEGVQVPAELLGQPIQKYNLAMAAHKECAEALTDA